VRVWILQKEKKKLVMVRDATSQSKESLSFFFAGQSKESPELLLTCASVYASAPLKEVASFRIAWLGIIPYWSRSFRQEFSFSLDGTAIGAPPKALAATAAGWSYLRTSSAVF
jgi:hypothetical protein